MQNITKTSIVLLSTLLLLCVVIKVAHASIMKSAPVVGFTNPTNRICYFNTALQLLLAPEAPLRAILSSRSKNVLVARLRDIATKDVACCSSLAAFKAFNDEVRGIYSEHEYGEPNNCFLDLVDRLGDILGDEMRDLYSFTYSVRCAKCETSMKGPLTYNVLRLGFNGDLRSIFIKIPKAPEVCEHCGMEQVPVIVMEKHPQLLCLDFPRKNGNKICQDEVTLFRDMRFYDVGYGLRAFTVYTIINKSVHVFCYVKKSAWYKCDDKRVEEKSDKEIESLIVSNGNVIFAMYEKK